MSEQAEKDHQRNAIIEIGISQREYLFLEKLKNAEFFISDLFNLYKRFAERKGWKIEVFDCIPGLLDYWSTVSFRVVGEGAFGELRWEDGRHRILSIHKIENRPHIVMARVIVIPEVEELDIYVDPKDVSERFRAGGGLNDQRANGFFAHCQITHIPTGVVVHCEATRRQQQNRALALKILRSKLYALLTPEVEKARGMPITGGNECIRTYDFCRRGCVDHRLDGGGKEWPLENIFDGQIGELIAELKAKGENK